MRKTGVVRTVVFRRQIVELVQSEWARGEVALVFVPSTSVMCNGNIHTSNRSQLKLVLRTCDEPFRRKVPSLGLLRGLYAKVPTVRSQPAAESA